MFSRTARKGHRIRQPVQSVEEIRQMRERRLYGSLGPASPVRKIDPKTGCVIEVIETKTQS